MAALSTDQVKRVWTDDGARRWALFAVVNVATGDTIDFATLGHFRVVKQSAWMAATTSGVAAATVTAPALVTAPAGLAADSCYVLVDGIPV